MFKWFWTIFSLGAPDKKKAEAKKEWIYETGQSNEENMHGQRREKLGNQEMRMSQDISKNQQLNPSADHFQACQELHGNDTVSGASNNQVLESPVKDKTKSWICEDGKTTHHLGEKTCTCMRNRDRQSERIRLKKSKIAEKWTGYEGD